MPEHIDDTPDPDPGPEPETEPETEREPLPDHKADLVALAIARKTPSYQAWAMTVPELKTLLED